MRISALDDGAIRDLVGTALDEGITMFDHADIYGGDHACERRFGEALDWGSQQRGQVLIQSKVGIRDGFYDSSAEHIVTSVEESLRALRTDYLDLLLIHRPDALAEPEEVAKAFDELEAAGKVRAFGVSNHSRGQMELLRATVRQPLVANQVQLSLVHAHTVAEGVALNMPDAQSVDRTSGILDYCRLTGTTLQAWSPFQASGWSGPFLGDRERFPELNDAVDELARVHGVPAEAIATAWIGRHPAGIQTILGTTRPERVRAAAAGAALVLSRPEWYRLFQAAGHILP